MAVKGAHATAVPRQFEIAALGVIALAAALRIWGLDAGLPHLMTRPDEEILVLKTGLPAQGIFDIDWPGQHPGIPSAYIYLLWIWGEVGLRVMQFFGAAPPGDYMTILQGAPDRLLLAERFLSACAGTATVAILLWVARREFGARVAIFAGLILATSVFHVRDSHSAKGDVAMSLFTILSLGLVAPLARDLTRRGVCLAGLAIGLAMAVKPPGVLLLLPAWIACMQGSLQRGWRRILPLEIFLLAGLSGAVFVVTSPDFVFNPETASRILAIPGFVLPKLYNMGAASLPGGEPRELVGALMWPGLIYNYEFALRYAFSLPLVLVLPLALVWGIFSRQSMAFLCSVFLVIAYLVFATSPVLLSRYMTPVLPVVALLVAAGVVAAVDRLGHRPMWARNMILVGSAVLFVWEPLVASVRFDRLMSVEDTRVQATQWMAEHTNKGDRIALHGAVFWTWGDPQVPRGRKIVRPELKGESLHEASADFLVAHDHPLFSSVTDWEEVAALGPSVRLAAEFDPFVEGRGPAVYERQDAFYLPTRGHQAVRAPGPLIRIYEIGPRQANSLGDP